VEIARRIWDLPGTQTLGISTNGTRLALYAKELQQAGVRSVNISLDALTPALYRKITGGDITAVFSGIQAARDAGFEVIKLNCVLMRGVNEAELWPLILFAAEHRLLLRFIELMPLSSADVLKEENFLSVQHAMQWITQKDTLIPQPDYRPGHGPATYYKLSSTGSRVGFIGALTNPHFCETCNKLRLTADGKLRPCLGRHGEIDLLPLLRQEGNLLEGIQEAIAGKPENHEFSNCYEPGRPMTAIGG
jgi:cyclic pyranopterin phosphate synthase